METRSVCETCGKSCYQVGKPLRHGEQLKTKPESLMQPFPCTQCGLCCQHVHLAAETRYLDRGDGVCRHYIEISNSCSIYAERPDICRVDKMYKLRYANQYSWSDFIVLNAEVCANLQLLSNIDKTTAISLQEIR